MPDVVYTIGHSTHSIEKFIGLLKVADIGAVSDVRSRPYSRMNPQFNREPLKQALRAAGIKYVFVGKELGARSDDQTCYRAGQVQYDLLAQTKLFKDGIERVKEGARTYHVALMCAEKEPLDCHRTILVARELVNQGLDVKHILSDGQIESHEHAIRRLIEKLRIPGSDMFRSNETAIDDAYARQGKEIAYREEAPEPPTTDRPLEHPVSGAAR
jgi:uncharacterized protein (DUF488 family)